MTSEQDICLICGQSRTPSTSDGSLTQWISSCRCELRAPEEVTDEPITLCAACGKSIVTRRSGSFTQWVLQSQICECVAPDQVSVADRTSGVKLERPSDEENGESQKAIVATTSSFPSHRYEAVRRLGGGASGMVYLCKDKHLNKTVSVKVLKFKSNQSIVAFQKEAQITAKFQHPNVISILDFGITDDGTPYMVLEYVDGVSLDMMIAEEGTIPVTMMLALFAQLTSALAKGHANGIFHRDIKSSNILVTKNKRGDIVGHLIDFGVALSSVTDQESTKFQGNTVVGTPRYMSPDQAVGKPYDARSEIYSLGCVMYECLTGHVPFDGESAMEVLAKHVQMEVPADFNESVPEQLKQIVLKCLAKRPDDRFSSMTQVCDALVQVSLSKEQLALSQEKLTAIEDQFFRAPNLNQTSPPQTIGSRLTWLLLLVAVVVPVMILLANQDGKDKVSAPKISLPVPARKEQLKHTPFNEGDIDGLPALSTLDPIKDSDLVWLRKYKLIGCVDLTDTQVTGIGFRQTPEVEIKTLICERCPIDDEGLQQIANIKALTTLYLVGNERLTDNSIKLLSNSETITTLVFGGTNFTETCIGNIRGIKNFTDLTLRRFELTRAAAYLLSTIDTLQVLVLSECKFDNQFIPQLRQSKRLKLVSLEAITIDETTADALFSLPVKYLDFTSCKIDTDTLKRFHGKKNVRRLMVSSPGATNKDIETLRKSLPLCTDNEFNVAN